jgi:2'-5' RNA ligase
MLKFSEFNNAPLAKKFVGLFVDKESQTKLDFWARSMNFDLTKDHDGQDIGMFPFHATLFYTNNEVRYINMDFVFPKIEAQFKGIELFGENNDIPVLTVHKSDKLLGLREYFEDQGFTDSRPWSPHVTLSYNWSPINPISNMVLPNFSIYFNRLVIEDQG